MPYNKTQREAAQELNIHESRLSRLRNQGTIKKSIRKVPGKNSFKYDVEKLRAELEDNLAPENRERRGKQPGEKVKEPTPEEKQKAIKKSKLAEEATGMSYSKARELNEAYKAALKKLEYEERSGKLVDVGKVERNAFEAGKAIKEQLVAIADRTAPLVAAESKDFECKQILLQEINYILESLSKLLEAGE